MTVQLPQNITGSNLFSGLFGSTEGGLLGGGLEGLFAQILGGVPGLEGLEGLEGLGENRPFSFDSLGLGFTGTGPFATLADVEDALAGLEFDPENPDAVSFEQLTVQIRKIAVTLQRTEVMPADIDPEVGELAGALHELGMPLNEAVAEAERIEAALNYAKKKAGILYADGGVEALKAHLPQLQSTTSLTQTSVDISITEIEFTRQQQVGLFQIQQDSAPVQSLSESVYLDKPLVKTPELKAAIQKVESGLAVPVDEGPVPEGSIIIDDIALEDGELPHIKGDQVARQAAADGLEVGQKVIPTAVKDGLPAQTKTAVKDVESQPIVNAQRAEDEALDIRADQRVGRVQQAEAPVVDTGSRTTLYTWQISKTGIDIVAQVNEAPVSDVMEAELLQSLGLEHDVVEGEGQMQANSSKPATFAERVAQFAKAANLGQQTGPVIKTLAEEGGGKVSLKLNPEELGEVEIELKIQDGRISGTIASARPEVVEQLARELHFLKQGLADAGFQLGEEGIAFQLQDDSSGGHGSEHEQDEAYADADVDSAIPGEEGSTASQGRWVNPDQVLDVTVKESGNMAEVTSTSSLTALATGTNSSKLNDLGFETFLKLLVTQLENQDPLNPMDSTQFTEQMATFSQLEQQMESNSYLAQLAEANDYSAQNLAVSYIGREALVPAGPEMTTADVDVLAEGEGASFAYNLDGAAANAKITIRNSEGEIVAEVDGTTASGINGLTWDGKDNDGNAVEAGTYTIDIDAKDADGEIVRHRLYTYGKIAAVSAEGGDIRLATVDGRDIDFNEVLQVRAAASTNG